MMIFPTPAAARYIVAGEPSAPVPMHNTVALSKRCCPTSPSSGNIVWRAQRFILLP